MRPIYTSVISSARVPVCNSGRFLLILKDMEPTPQGQAEQDEEVLTHEPAKVVLFNDDVHTFDEVIVQLIKATRCPRTKAEALAWEVHTKGKAIVFSGEIPRCMEVSGILEEIQLLTQIEM